MTNTTKKINLPAHLVEMLKKHEARQKAVNPTAKIIDRTPEGFGPTVSK